MGDRQRRTPTGIETASDRELLAMILNKVNHVEHLLTGSEDPSKGIVVRVDRLEQSESRRTWFVRTALGASVVAIVAAFWRLIGVNH